MNQVAIRNYSYSDALLLAHVGKIVEQLPNDLSIVEEETGIIDQAFLDELKTDYVTALEEGGDDVARNRVGNKTQILVNAIDDAKKIVRRIRFYVGEAFEGDPAGKKAFNLFKFWKVANNQPELIKFMNALAKVVEANKDALIEKGAKETLIASVSANAKALAEADAIQEGSKGGREKSTQTRIVSLNSLYKRALKLDRATDLAFESDPIKASFYNLPQTSPKADEVVEEVN